MLPMLPKSTPHDSPSCEIWESGGAPCGIAICRRRGPMRIQAWMKHPVITVKPHLTLAPAAFVADAARLMRRDRLAAPPIVEGGRRVGIPPRSGVPDAFVEPSYSTLPSG